MPIQGRSYRRLSGAVLIVLLAASSATAQRSTTSSSSSGLGRGGAGSGGGSTPTVGVAPSPSSTYGGGSSYSNIPHQRSYSPYELDQQRARFLYGNGHRYGSGYYDDWMNPYGTRWSRSYVPRLSGDTKPSFVSFTSLAAPKAARKAHKKAEKQLNKPEPNLDLAAQHLQEAISIYPEYAAAWALLGRVQRRAGDSESAAKSLERSIEIDPKYLGAYEPLAGLAVEQKRWGDLLRLSDEMLRINPVFTLGHYYKGGALIQKGDQDGAEKALQAALSSPDAELFPESHYMLAELYRSQNEVELAAREYRLYTAAPARSPSWEQAWLRLQQWENSGVIEDPSARKKRKKPAESR